MKHLAACLSPVVLIAAEVLVPVSNAVAQPATTPIERFRRLEFSPVEENFDKGWQDRVAVEFDVINDARLEDLRTALTDKDPFVRSLAARALGIRSDKESADALAGLARSDPEHIVRIRAIEALALLKMHAETIDEAKRDRHLAVQWSANLAARQFKSSTNDAAVLRQAYAAGIKREAMGAAQVGKPAPDFAARFLDGKSFHLSDVIGKKPIAIYFAAYDG